MGQRNWRPGRLRRSCAWDRGRGPSQHRPRTVWDRLCVGYLDGPLNDSQGGQRRRSGPVRVSVDAPRICRHRPSVRSRDSAPASVRRTPATAGLLGRCGAASLRPDSASLRCLRARRIGPVHQADSELLDLGEQRAAPAPSCAQTRPRSRDGTRPSRAPSRAIFPHFRRGRRKDHAHRCTQLGQFKGLPHARSKKQSDPPTVCD